MHNEHESPVHPLLNDLILNYKHFSHIEFPRGIPSNTASEWRPLLQSITKAEANCIQQVHQYLIGESANLTLALCPTELKRQLESFRSTDDTSREYAGKLLQYTLHIEKLGFQLEDCIASLGNPLKVFRHEKAQGISLKNT